MPILLILNYLNRRRDNNWWV